VSSPTSLSKTLILASQSASRRAMLEAAGIPHKAIRPLIDEAATKMALSGRNLSAAELAAALALEKANSVSDMPMPGLILGCDQILECHDGTRLDKAETLGELIDQLRHLSGKSHRLHSAAVIVEDHLPVWRATESARMTMRHLSGAFIADYVAREGEALLSCVGGYRIEGLGAQLFSAVEGSHFAIRGLPLLPLLDFLRSRGVMAA
jgi:septum formation protein